VSSSISASSPESRANLDALHARVIALENAVIALLANQAEPAALMRELAAQIAPKPGYTQHPLTQQAVTHMAQLLERTAHFQAPA
jgi:hypothetical protein